MPDTIDFQIIPHFAIMEVSRRGEITVATVAGTGQNDKDAQCLIGRNMHVLFGISRDMVLDRLQQGPFSIVVPVVSSGILASYELQFYPSQTNEELIRVVASNVSHYVAAQNETFAIVEKQNRHISELERCKTFGYKVLASVAHDLRGPINAMVAAAQLLTDTRTTMQERDLVIESFGQQTQPLAKLVDNLFRWSTVAMGHWTQQSTAVDILPIVMQVVGLLTHDASQKMISIETDIEDGIVAWCSADEIGFVIRNLMANAIKFTPQGGRVVVSAYTDDTRVHIAVADNGIGMNDELQEELFSPSGSGTRYGTAGESGTGIGFLLCREYVARNGGELHVASAPGSGSLFSVSLPMPLSDADEL